MLVVVAISDAGNGREVILGGKKFDFPKSLYLLIDTLKLTSTKNSTVLDFFAGSGTTGHAVLELNKQDGGKRKFILCTNNENNIAEEVTYERLKENSIRTQYFSLTGKRSKEPLRKAENSARITNGG